MKLYVLLNRLSCFQHQSRSVNGVGNDATVSSTDAAGGPHAGTQPSQSHLPLSVAARRRRSIALLRHNPIDVISYVTRLIARRTDRRIASTRAKQLSHLTVA